MNKTAIFNIIAEIVFTLHSNDFVVHSKGNIVGIIKLRNNWKIEAANQTWDVWVKYKIVFDENIFHHLHTS